MRSPKKYEAAYGKHHRQILDVYPTHKSDPKTVIIFWHGGSWNSGDKKRYGFIGRALNRLGYDVIIPNYRLYPEVKFPTFLDDGALAVAWVATKYPSTRIVLMGHSAGAYFAAMLAFDKQYLVKIGLTPNRIGGFIGLSGPYNFNPWPSIAKVFEPAPKQEWNPIDRISKPAVPTLLIHGQRDKTVKLSNSQQLNTKIIKQGGSSALLIYPVLGHVSILLPFIVNFWFFGNTKQRLLSFIGELESE